MKFAHIADCHVGNWRDTKMKELVIQSFETSIDKSLEKEVDFIIIAGDLFHTAVPSIDLVKRVFHKLKEVETHNIPIYYIAGSHDYSPSGKTMLDLIEQTGLGTNVMRGNVQDEQLNLTFTEDQQTGAKLTGLIGRRGLLEKRYYEELDRESLEQEDGFKIFLFHTALDEMKPEDLKKMDSNPVSFLPQGFDYYAGGHVHIVDTYEKEGYQNIVYPGPVFPANFAELEKLGHGGFYIYDDGELTYQPLKLKDTVQIHIDGDGTVNEWETILANDLKDKDVSDKIILLRIEGNITDGSKSDLPLQQHIEQMKDDGAYRILTKTTKLQSEEYEEITRSFDNETNIEQEVIQDNLSDQDLFNDEERTMKTLIKELKTEKKEGETNKDYEQRVKENTKDVLEGELQ